MKENEDKNKVELEMPNDKSERRRKKGVANKTDVNKPFDSTEWFGVLCADKTKIHLSVNDSEGEKAGVYYLSKLNKQPTFSRAMIRLMEEVYDKQLNPHELSFWIWAD